MSGFNIPNTPDASNQNQAEPDSVDFQILGNQSSGVVSGMTVTVNGSGSTIDVASGEVLINGVYHAYAGNTNFPVTTFSTSSFFDLVVARFNGTAVTPVVIPGNSGTNPRFPAINDSTDVVLASIWRTGSTITSNQVVDKRIFVRSTVARTESNTVSSNRGSTGDLYVNTSWTPSATSTASPLSVKVGSTWYNLSYWPANASITTTGNITANAFIGNLTGNVIGNLTGNADTATSAINATNSTYLQGFLPSTVGTITGDNSIVQRSISGQIKSSWFEAQVDAAHFYSTTTHTNFGAYCFRVVNSSTVWATAITGGRTVLVNSNGTLGTSASTRRVKENIEPLVVDVSKVLEIEPVTFLYKQSSLEADAVRRVEVGVIAEQIDELGFDELVFRDRDGLPDGFAYEKLAIYLLEVVKHQNSQIEDLLARVQALENA